MPTIISNGLTAEETAYSSDQEMVTIRLNGNHVASISYNSQTDRTDTTKSGFWVQFVEISALNAEQIEEIERLVASVVTKHMKKIFGGQT
jgi:hypothetical protein